MKVSLKSAAVLYFVVGALFVVVAILELVNANRQRSLTAILTAAFFATLGFGRLKSWRAQQAVEEPRSAGR